MRGPSRRGMTGASMARHSAWAYGMSTPDRASSNAGSTSRFHSSLPWLRQSSPRPAPARADPQGGRGEPLPLELSVAAPELSEARWDPRHRAGRDPHLVVHDLV